MRTRSQYKRHQWQAEIINLHSDRFQYRQWKVHEQPKDIPRNLNATRPFPKAGHSPSWTWTRTWTWTCQTTERCDERRSPSWEWMRRKRRRFILRPWRYVAKMVMGWCWSSTTVALYCVSKFPVQVRVQVHCCNTGVGWIRSAWILQWLVLMQSVQVALVLESHPLQSAQYTWWATAEGAAVHEYCHHVRW